jgi:hypothetical protein
MDHDHTSNALEVGEGGDLVTMKTVVSDRGGKRGVSSPAPSSGI